MNTFQQAKCHSMYNKKKYKIYCKMFSNNYTPYEYA